MTKTKISLRNIHKCFGENEVLRGITLDIDAQSSQVIIGGSGSGKSVLLKCILGHLKPEKGEIIVDGVDILKLSARERTRFNAKIGMLFQGGALFDSMDVWHNVAFRLLEVQKLKANNARQQAITTLEQVGLDESHCNLRMDALSGGMKKRVALARAIISQPEIIFFDEPTTGLDPINAAMINMLINEQVRALGATAITITHDIDSVMAVADQVACIHEGRIIWNGTKDKLHDSGNSYVDDFIHGRYKAGESRNDS